MKKLIQYGTGVVVLPAAAVQAAPPDAVYLRVLIAACADPNLLSQSDCAAALAEACGLTHTIAENALAYWSDLGILSDADEIRETPSASTETKTEPVPAYAERDLPQSPEPEPQPANTPPEPAPATAQPPHIRPNSVRLELPRYTLAQTAAALEHSPELRPTLNACEQMMGRIFSEHDNAQLAALYECYGLDSAYLMTLIAYCKKQKNDCAVSYVIRTALGLYDEGVRTVSDLEEKLARKDALSTAEGQIRRLFGMDEKRTLSANEQTYIENWTLHWSMPMDVIRRAYDITVDRCTTPRLSYTNKILSKWHEAGLSTLEAVDAAEAAYRAKNANGASAQNNNDAAGEHSFDTDEFLNLALKRSFRT